MIPLKLPLSGTISWSVFQVRVRVRVRVRVCVFLCVRCVFVCFCPFNAPTGLSELRIKTDPVESFDIACEIDPQPLHQVRLARVP